MLLGTQKKPPRLDISNVPRMKLGMGDKAAYLSGYRHGYEGLNTLHICSLTKGTTERAEWMKGYYEGQCDAGDD
jgi:ribosome modulation factor